MQRVGNPRRKESDENNAKKNTIQYKERDEQRREAFIAEVEGLPEDSELYYGDESGFDEYYGREYGYAPRGEKVIGKVSGKHFARTNMIAAKTNSDVIASFAFSGTMNSDLFLGWLEHLFAPELKSPGKSVLFLDNATHHPKEAILEIAWEYGFRVMFIPPHSPDLNKPIENFWANVKRRLRDHMHSFSSFWDAISHAFISP